MSAFTQELKRLRGEHRLSQSRLAELAGVDHSMVSRLEGGTRRPTAETVVDLCRAMRLSPFRTMRLMLAAGFVPADAPVDGLMDVLSERARQYRRWGLQELTWPEWMLILIEEVGEAAQAANGAVFASTLDADRARYVAQMRDELVQVAAVALQIVEAIDGEAAIEEERVAA